MTDDYEAQETKLDSSGETWRPSIVVLHDDSPFLEGACCKSIVDLGTSCRTPECSHIEMYIWKFLSYYFSLCVNIKTQYLLFLNHALIYEP